MSLVYIDAYLYTGVLHRQESEGSEPLAASN